VSGGVAGGEEKKRNEGQGFKELGGMGAFFAGVRRRKKKGGAVRRGLGEVASWQLRSCLSLWGKGGPRLT